MPVRAAERRRAVAGSIRSKHQVTIDRIFRRATSLARGCAIAAGVFTAWCLGVVVWTATVAPFKTVMVFGKPTAAFRTVAASPSATIVGGNSFMLVVSADEPWFVRGLYSAGAWLVLPANEAGCLSLARSDGRDRPGR